MHGDALGSTRHGQAPSSSDRANSDRLGAIFFLGSGRCTTSLCACCFFFVVTHTYTCIHNGVWLSIV